MPIQPRALVAAFLGLLLPAMAGNAAAAPIRLVVLGDSLTAGYGLAASDAFPVRLEAALKAKGYDVIVANAGVSGDTVTDGLERLDWSVGPDAEAVVVELGGNDMLRGIEPKVTSDALDTLLAQLGERHLPVLVAGMVAPPNLGKDYAAAFDGIFADLASKHGDLLYPFFLDGVAAQPSLNQADGIHPNPAGVAIIVDRILPSVEALLATVKPAS